MFSPEKVEFVEVDNEMETRIVGRATLYSSVKIANEMLEQAIPKDMVLDRAKEKIQREIWDELYGEILNRVLELKRTMTNGTDFQAMNSLVEMLDYKE